jgi:hypothetical protein
MKSTRAVPVLLAAVLLVACAASGPSPGGDGDDGPIDHPTGDELVLAIENRGGFVPPQFLATQTPTFALMGDGRVVVQGAQVLIFPGPALPPLQTRRLTEEGMQTILREVVATGLFDADLELRGAQAVVADASDTAFILHAGGRDVTVSVYALGLITPDMQPPQGVSADELRAHQVLQGMQDRLLQLDTWLSEDAWQDTGWQPYEPTAFRLYVRDATNDVPEAGVAQEVRTWPEVSADPASFGTEEPLFGDGTRCAAVTGDEAAAWLAELGAANQNTRWSVDGEKLYAVSPRPLLPYEEASCPELAPGA